MSKLIILLTLIITAISEETINITTSDMTGGSSYTIIYNGLRKFPNNIYFNGLEIFQYEPNNTDTYYEITDDNYLNIIPVTSGGPNEITLFYSSEVESFENMFANCSEIIKSISFSDEVMSGTTNMISMFESCSKLTEINNLNPIKVKYMNKAFKGCTSLVSISFNYNNRFEQIRNMENLFEGCIKLESLDLENFKTDRVTSMEKMFYNCQSLQSINFGPDFKTYLINNMSYIFYNCRALETLNLNNFERSGATDMSSMFYNCINLKELSIEFSTPYVDTMNRMFSNCQSLTSVDLSKFITSNVKDMELMFYYCVEIRNITFPKSPTNSLEKMVQMFNYFRKLKEIINLSYFKTQNVQSMHSLFSECNAIEKLNLSSFYIKEATSMAYMFYQCNQLRTLILPDFDNNNKVTDFSHMFQYCSSLSNSDFSSFKTSNALNMNNMFSYSGFNSLNLYSFSTLKVTNMVEMFFECRKLNNLNISNFNTQQVTHL